MTFDYKKCRKSFLFMVCGGLQWFCCRCLLPRSCCPACFGKCPASTQCSCRGRWWVIPWWQHVCTTFPQELSCIIFCLNWLMLVNVFWTKANDSYIVSSWFFSFYIMTSICCVLCLLVKPMSLLWDFIMEDCGCWMVLIRDNWLLFWEVMDIGWLLWPFFPLIDRCDCWVCVWYSISNFCPDLWLHGVNFNNLPLIGYISFGTYICVDWYVREHISMYYYLFQLFIIDVEQI